MTWDSNDYIKNVAAFSQMC